MRPDDNRGDRGDHPGGRRGGQGGVPDGLLIGILAFLLGMTLLVWSATGLAAWFSHGAWPRSVTFLRTPAAMRHLVTAPHDLPGAWPDTAAGRLPGWGLFWGLFIGQLMILFVLAVFLMGTVARWRAGRRSAARGGAARGAAGAAAPTAPAAAPAAGPAHPPYTHEVPLPRSDPEPLESLESLEPLEDLGNPQNSETAPLVPLLPLADPIGTAVRGGRRETLLVADRERRRATATLAVRDAEGPVLVVTSNPAVWQDTKDARAKLGPVLLYDPNHLCDTPARLHWSPTAGCEDKATAAARAAALLAPVRPTAKIDQAVADTAETLLRCCLHAAAIDGRTVRHVHRWAQGSQIQDAVRALRTSPKAAPGCAGELEAALTAHPERRDIAQELTGRALAALATVNIREACTPHRTDALALDSFVNEGGTLYLVGESIEDPRANPGAMPLLTALAASVVERGRRMAERSSSGRLDPPMTLVLDDVAAVAPLPQLPDLLSTGADHGLPTLALLRSREQGRTRWPHDELPV